MKNAKTIKLITEIQKKYKSLDCYRYKDFIEYRCIRFYDATYVNSFYLSIRYEHVDITIGDCNISIVYLRSVSISKININKWLQNILDILNRKVSDESKD